MTDSQQLLAEYVKTGSEPAFGQLVAGYTDLVYSVAVRLADGDVHLAKDVAQTVFIDLARMAPRLPGGVALGGWLHRHTCFLARKAIRTRLRRQARERQAAEMNALEDHSEANLARVAPLLDEAIDRLRAEDWTAILLRFYERRDLRSVGRALGCNDHDAEGAIERVAETPRRGRQAEEAIGRCLEDRACASIRTPGAAGNRSGGAAGGPTGPGKTDGRPRVDERLPLICRQSPGTVPCGIRRGGRASPRNQQLEPRYPARQ